MFNVAECPYCGEENDMSDALCDGCPSDNTIDWECEHCEKEFQVYIEFEPIYYPSKIVYEECEICSKSVRDIYNRSKMCPYPKHVKENKICRQCWGKNIAIEMEGWR